MPVVPRHILIVGGGEFGLTAALALRLRGWRVTVLEAATVPRPTAASTDISKVVRVDYGADALNTRLGELALEGWQRWNHDWEQTLYHADGFLVLTRHPLKEGTFEGDSYRYLTTRGHELEQLDAAAISARYPAWADAGFQAGYLNPIGGWAASGLTMAILAAKAKAAGVVIREQTTFDCFLEKDSRVVGVEDSHGVKHRADLVMISAGAWTPTLLPHLGKVMHAIAQPVFHFKVDDAAAFQSPRFPVWAADIASTGWYGFPALNDGTLKIANHGPGRRIHPDAPRDVVEEELAHVRAFLKKSLPQLADAPLISNRLCLYCDTFDSHFWIDRDTQRPGLIVAAGDSGHAFKFAPVMGDLIADVVEEKDNPLAQSFRTREPAAKTAEGARWSGKS